MTGAELRKLLREVIPLELFERGGVFLVQPGYSQQKPAAIRQLLDEICPGCSDDMQVVRVASIVARELADDGVIELDNTHPETGKRGRPIVGLRLLQRHANEAAFAEMVAARDEFIAECGGTLDNQNAEPELSDWDAIRVEIEEVELLRERVAELEAQLEGAYKLLNWWRTKKQNR